MKAAPSLSIIIPCLQEENYIARCLDRVLEAAGPNIQLIIVDSSADNNTKEIIAGYASKGVEYYKCPLAQRATQMNLGADKARASALFFLHGDCLVPERFDRIIVDNITQGHLLGQFTVTYNGGPPMLRIQEKLSAFRTPFSGGGDQGMWVSASIFSELNGFNAELNCMEDFDFFRRASKIVRPIIARESILASARKYDNRNYSKIQMYNLAMLLSFYCSGKPDRINHIHRKFSA